MLSKEARALTEQHPELKQFFVDLAKAAVDHPITERLEDTKWRYGTMTFERRRSGAITGPCVDQADLPLLVTNSAAWYREAQAYIDRKWPVKHHQIFSILDRLNITHPLRHHFMAVIESFLDKGFTKRQKVSTREPAYTKRFIRHTGHWLWYELLDPEIASFTIKVFGHQARIADYNVLATQYTHLRTLPLPLVQFWAPLLRNVYTLPLVGYRYPSEESIVSDLQEVASMDEKHLQCIKTMSPATARFLSRINTARETPPNPYSRRVVSIFKTPLPYDIIVRSRTDTLKQASAHFHATQTQMPYTLVWLLATLRGYATASEETCQYISKLYLEHVKQHRRPQVRAKAKAIIQRFVYLSQCMGTTTTTTLLNDLEANSLNDLLDHLEQAETLMELQGKRPRYPLGEADTFPF